MAAYRRVITVDLASRNGHLIGINQGNASDVAWVWGKAKISPRQEPEGAEDGVGWSEMGRPGERTNIATVNAWHRNQLPLRYCNLQDVVRRI